MPRFVPTLLLALLPAACTGDNPLYGVGTPDAADADAARDLPADLAIDSGAVDTSVPDTSGSETPAPIPGALGAACTGPGACQSGFCVDGVCCDTACRERCRTCALPGSPGTCALIPAGADPRAECLAQDPATCGRAGGCDGQGECQLHPSGTECRARSCNAGVEIGASSCNGSGTCMPGVPTSCTLAACTGDRCTMGCTAASCPTGWECQAGRCTSSGTALHWRFDETSGSSATDASANGFTGSYRGDSALPAPSAMVPPGRFTNPRSLSFGAGASVQLTPIPSVLRPPRTLTVSVWYRATAAPASGADLVNAGDDYILRIRPTDVEFAKRKSDTEGVMYQLATARNLTRHLDGNWHHLAGVVSATTVNLYLDGSLLVSKPNADPILHRGSTLFVGAAPSHPFQGNLDDLRVYPRDLSITEIGLLATGNEP